MATTPKVVSIGRNRRLRKIPKHSKKKAGVSRKKGKARYQRKRFIVPLVERVKIVKAYLEGGPDNSCPKLAVRFGRSLDTVYAIVNAPEVQQVGKAMEQKLVETYAEDVVDRIGYEVKTKKSKAGAWIAMELARDWGALPPKTTRQQIQSQSVRAEIDLTSLPEEQRVKFWVEKLTESTLERGRIFGMPLPEFEEAGMHMEEETIPLFAKKDKAKA